MADLVRLTSFIHINPTRGKILADHMSPVVAMKKIKLGPSDASGLAAATCFLPELTDADDKLDYESQRARREGAAGTGQHEEVPFINTLTQDELNDHVQKCLEMSSENKINQKNAFALQLIDCFSFLQKKKDFSAMACTLDAGTKIYSCRVDALHQQVVKLADEVVMSSREDRAADKDGKSLAEKGSTKEQRKARKNKLIASSETLKRQMKARDPKDKYLRFEPLPGAIMSGARRDASDLSLSLERYTPFWPNWDNYKPLKAEGMVTLPDVKIFREKSQTMVLETPESLPEADQYDTNAEQAFDHNDDDAKDVSEVKHLSESEMSVTNPPSEYYSENDGENHSVTDDIENLVSSASRLGEGEVDVVSTAMDRLKVEAEADGAVNRAPSRMEALKMLFDVSSEYDYLKMKNRNYWAGPEFWKRPQVVQTESEKEKRKVVPNKKREPAEILYDFKDLDERLLVLSKKGSSLSERVVRGWKKKRTTLPRDLKVEISWFLNLFHIESCGEKSEESEIVQKSTSFVDVLETFEGDREIIDNSTDPITDPFSSDHEDISSSPDPMNATFYEAAPSHSDNSEPRDPLDSAFYDAGPSNKEPGKIIRVEVASSSTLDFGESFMIPAPKMVNVDPIKYSTRPIRVDMLHLKNAMLTVIREEIEKDAREKKILIVPEVGLAESKPGVRFRTVLKCLPRKLERRTREDVSMQIAFTAVLSLANENSLQLEKCDDGDFVVMLPDSPVLVSEEESDAESRLQ